MNDIERKAAKVRKAAMELELQYHAEGNKASALAVHHAFASLTNDSAARLFDTLMKANEPAPLGATENIGSCEPD